MNKDFESANYSWARLFLWTAVVVVAALFLVFWAINSCKPKDTPFLPRALPARSVGILEPAVSNRTALATVKMVRGLFPDASMVSSGPESNGLAGCLAERRVLVVPDSTHLPIDLWRPVQEYMASGGGVLFIGRNPFEARVRRTNGLTKTEAELFRELMEAARPVDGFSVVQGWQHLNDTEKIRGSVRVVKGSPLPWPAVSVETDSLTAWDAMVLDTVPGAALTAEGNSLAFYARGDVDTSCLVILCDEQDGSRWVYPVPLSEAWRPVVVREEKFRYSYGGVARGGAGDHLKFERVIKISAGLSMALAPQSPGRHSYGLSDIRLALDPRGVEEAVDEPDWPVVAPSYRRYDFKAWEVRSLVSEGQYFTGAVAMQSPLPRPMGMGGESAASHRWIPLFHAFDKKGNGQGWPAGLCVASQPRGPGQKWGWIGLDPSEATADAVREMLAECVTRLYEGIFLFNAGCDRFAYEGGDMVHVTARWTGSNTGLILRTTAELLSTGEEEEPEVVRRASSAPSSTEMSAAIDLGAVDRLEDVAGDYTLRITLEDAFQHGRVYDQVEQPLKFLPGAFTATPGEWITTSGSQFTRGKRPVFMLGINYWPFSANGRSPGEINAHWLDVSVFDPSLVRTDLKRLEEAGVNAVAVQFHDEKEAPQLKFFVDEARKHRVNVLVYLDYLNPFSLDTDKAQKLVQAGGLAGQPQVFGIDLAWEPNLGHYPDRCRLDTEWERWLIEQYESVDHAEKVIGRPVWRRDGGVTGPSDQELATDGDHRTLVAVYRRFVDDYVSRRYGCAKRLLRGLGCRQLLTARAGYGGSGSVWANPCLPVDLASGVMHLDFISPEGWGLNGEVDRFYEAGFITAYARGMSDGKPVVWLEFGGSIGMEPQAVDYENQARLYDNFFELFLKSDVAGCFAWWYPGGFRVEEGSDMGVVNPDGTWRPAGERIQACANRFRREVGLPGAWKGREVNRFADARGLSALWDAWRNVYREETRAGAIEEIRPQGFKKRTTAMPLVSVGGVPFDDPAPLEWVNAEWGRTVVDGEDRLRMPGTKLAMKRKQNLRLELFNSGPATWATSEEGKAQTVWVRVENPQGSWQFLKADPLAFGGSMWISWTASDTGTWKIRPYLLETGGFGEQLEVEVGEEVESF